jgi:DNA mismatch repair protein MutS2
MAFDESARTPTYAIVLGVPGRSRALETAERLGMPQDVLMLARGYLSREHREFEGMLARLEQDAETAARARKEAVAAREEAEKMKREWTERTSTSVNEMLERTRQKLRRILEQAQDEVRVSVRRLDEVKSRAEVAQARSGLSGAFAKSASKIETALSEEAPELAETLAIERAETPALAEPPKIEVGVTVRVPKWKSLGTVVELMGAKAKVKMGTIQMTLALADMEALSADETAKLHPQTRAAASPGKARTVITDQDRPPAPARQLDLRGTRYEEAMGSLERYLDQAYRSGALAEVVIVHGLGTGALREGARRLLAELPYVKEFRDGGAGQGGAGATVVEFDR